MIAHRIDPTTQNRHGRYAPFVPCLLAAILGILIDSELQALEKFFSLNLIASLQIPSLLIGSVIILLFFRPLRERLLTSSAFVLILVAFCYGGAYRLHTDFFPKDDIGRNAPKKAMPVFIEGWVESRPDIYEYSPRLLGQNIEKTVRTSFFLRVRSISDHHRTFPRSGRLAVDVEEKVHSLRIGDLVKLKGTYLRTPPELNPYEEEKSLRHLSDRVRAQLKVDHLKNILILKKADRYRFARFFDAIRYRCQETLDRELPPRNAALAKAMLLGLRADLNEETITAFRQTGTIHILAISGLHLVILSSFLLLFLRLFRFSARSSALLVSLLLIIYLLISGMAPPILRATTIFIAFSLALLFQRQPNSLNSFVLSALVVLLINPCYLFQFGVWLSFMATGVFLWLPYDDSRSLLQKPYLAYRDGLIIWLVLLPLILYKTNLLTPVALLANPPLLIPMTLALIGGVCLMTIGSLSVTLGSLFTPLVNGIFDLFFLILDRLHSIPWGKFWVPGPPGWWCLGLYIPLILATLYPALRKYKRSYLIFLLLWSLLAATVFGVTRWNNYHRDRLRIEIFSVGHGSAFLLHFPDSRTILLDCGSFSSPQRVSRLISKSLWREGKTKIDLVIFSHADSDHYNGFEDLPDCFSIGTVIVPPLMFDKENKYIFALKDLLDQKKIPIVTKRKGESLSEFGFSELRFLHPSLQAPLALQADKTNANSLVVLLEHRERRVLFPGDLDSNGAPFLNELPIDVDVLLAPHHGGKSENYERLLDWCRPKTIVISGGAFHRNPLSENKLRLQGYVVHNTIESGAVRIKIERAPKRSTAGSLDIRTLRPSEKEER